LDASQVFLHVGLHKTGTTFLQRKVFPHLPVNLLVQPRIEYLAEEEDYDPDRFREMLGRQFEIKPGCPTVISQEAFSGRALGSPRWDPFRMARRLHQTFPAAKVLLVVRSQPSYILSLYCFRVVRRGWEYHGLDGYLERYFEPALYPKLSYHRLVETYQELFGPERFKVMAYEQLRRDHHTFVSEVLRFMGMDREVAYDYRPVNQSPRKLPVVQINRLLNLPVAVTAESLLRAGVLTPVKYVALANLYFSAKARLVAPVLERLFRHSFREIRFSPAWERRLQEAFASSNRRLAQMTGLDLASMGYPW